MSLRPPDRSLLEDMLDWAQKVQRFVSDVSEDVFLEDERTQSAVIHGLAHDYLGIDVDEVWRTAIVDVPELERRLLVALGRD